MIPIERFTEQAQEVLAITQRLLGQLRHQAAEPEHLLLAMIEQPNGLAVHVLHQLGADTQSLRAQLQSWVERQPKTLGSSSQQLYFTERSRTVVEVPSLQPTPARTSSGLSICLQLSVTAGLATFRSHGVAAHAR